MDLARKMTRAELNELNVEERKERLRLQNVNKSRKYKEKNPDYSRKYREENPEKEKKRKKKYYEENLEKEKKRGKKYYETNQEQIIEKSKKYKQTSAGKKVNTLSQWKKYGLQETKEELDIIYELYLTQELCYSCDCILTSDGTNCPTQACMDHCHITHKFRQICCRSCNTNDSWMKYWC
jgi:hypothetical protein